MSQALCAVDRCRGDQEPRETRGADHLCHVCTERLRKRIAEAPALVSWLAAHVQPGRHGESDKVRGGGFVAPIPVRADVLSVIGPAATEAVLGNGDDQDNTLNIPAELDSWCQVLVEERTEHDGGTYAGPRGGKPETTAAYLLAHLEWIVQQQWAVELHDEMGRMHRTAFGLAPWDAGRHEVPGECPSCDLKALVRYDGSSYVQCEIRAGGCGRLISEDDYQFFVRVLVNEQEAS